MTARKSVRTSSAITRRTRGSRAAKRKPEQRDVRETKVIQHRAHRLVPFRSHWHACFQRGALSGPVKRYNIETFGLQSEQDGKPLLDVAVESAKNDELASC